MGRTAGRVKFTQMPELTEKLSEMAKIRALYVFLGIPQPISAC